MHRAGADARFLSYLADNGEGVAYLPVSYLLK
jgi:hypothetical protein